MAEPAFEFTIDVSNLVTEDDEPVENPFQDKQMRLLTESLYTGWQPDFPFVAMSDVGLYHSLHEYLVPDVMVSTRVALPADLQKKENRAYLLWEYGKVPDIVVEIVSNQKGGELSHKFDTYARWMIPYYVVYDPSLHLGDRPLRCFEISAQGYVEFVKPGFAKLGLGLTLWTGTYEDHHDTWLRWCDLEQRILPFGKEAATRAYALAEQERQRADKADEQLRLLRQRLREAGLEP